MTYRERAENLFKEGYNCSQSVFAAFAPDFGMSFEDAVKFSSGLGGGVGRLREVCGAVTGMALVLSLKYGEYDPKDHEAKMSLYSKIQFVAEEFRKVNGAIVCRELLGNNEHSPVPSPRNDEFFHKRPCVQMVGSAAEILEKFFRDND